MATGRAKARVIADVLLVAGAVFVNTWCLRFLSIGMLLAATDMAFLLLRV